MQHCLPVDHLTIFSQEQLTLPVKDHETRYQAQAKAGGKCVSHQRVPVQPEDLCSLAQVAFDPIDDGIGQKAARSEV